MTRLVLAVAAGIGGWLAAAPAVAQIFMPSEGSASAGAQNIEGITVAGKGTVLVRPNRMEIELTVAAASELTADAIVKFRDAKKRLEDAFRELKLDGVAVTERGLLVDQKGMMMNPYYFDGMANRRAKTEVQLSRKLVVVCDGIREMDEDAVLQRVAKLLDVAQDAGGQVGTQPEFNPYYYRPYVGGSGLARFVLDDFDAQREEAYAKAVADARAKAQRLARLSGVTLGPVVAVRELSVPGERPGNAPEVIYPGMAPPAGEAEPTRQRVESAKFEEIPIRVELLVRFDIRPASGGTAGAAER
jgi:uncharacterized protein YggE